MNWHQNDHADHNQCERENAMDLEDAVFDDKGPQLLLLNLDLPSSAEIRVNRASSTFTLSAAKCLCVSGDRIKFQQPFVG